MHDGSGRRNWGVGIVAAEGDFSTSLILKFEYYHMKETDPAYPTEYSSPKPIENHHHVGLGSKRKEGEI